MGLSSGEKQQAICARGSEANAEHVTVGRLSRLELYKAVTIEGSCERKRDWKKKPRLRGGVHVLNFGVFFQANSQLFKLSRVQERTGTGSRVAVITTNRASQVKHCGLNTVDM